MANRNGDEPQTSVLSTILADKEMDTAQVREAQRRSVEEQNPIPAGFANDVGVQVHDDNISPLIFAMAQAGDGMVPWGTAPTARDRQIRAFIPTEAVLAGAHSSIIARNEAMPWVVKSDEKDIALRDACVELLRSSDRGAGWMSLVGKVSFDLYAADKGAFVEFIRAKDRPDEPIIGINHLDSTRCFSTGRDDFPVMYRDVKSRWHKLAWYQVWHLLEMPTPHETMYGLQLCAVSRAMRAAQVWRNINTYMDEKTGGRHTRSIAFVSGVVQRNLEEALAESNAIADSELRERYARFPIVVNPDPNGSISVEQLEFSSIPDGFDSEKEFRQYLIVLALGYLVDLQEFAPLQGGSIGSASQSETLNAKARAKSPQLFRSLIEDMMNRGGVCLPGVEFKFMVDDPETDKLVAENEKVRAESRKLRIDSGEIDAQAARQLALDAGDLPDQLFEELSNRDDLTPETALSGSSRPVGNTDQGKAVSDRRRRAERVSADAIEDPVLSDMETNIRRRLEIGESS